MIARRFRLSRRANDWTRFAQIVCSEGDGCIRSDRESRVLDESAKYNAVWQPIGRPVARQKNDICAMSRRAPELNRLPKA